MAGDADNFVTQHPHRPRVQHGRRRAAARRRRAALVRRDDRLLGRRSADHLDVEHPGLDGRTARSSSRASCRRSRSTRRTATPRARSSGSTTKTMFYDPEALVEPIRIVRNFDRAQRLRRRRSVPVHRMRSADLPGQRPRHAGVARHRRSSTRCPTCTAGRGRRSGRSITRRAWSGPRPRTFSASNRRVRRRLQTTALARGPTR